MRDKLDMFLVCEIRKEEWELLRDKRPTIMKEIQSFVHGLYDEETKKAKEGVKQ